MKVKLIYHEVFEFDVDDSGRPIEPKCPECGAGIRRNKCLFELDPSRCPRHKLLRAYNIALKEFEERQT